MIDIQQICSKYRIKIQKGLGQNFLQNNSVLERIIDAAQLIKDDVVLEIGPGVGVLTQYLVASAHKVLAIELDEKLVSVLQKEFSSSDNLEVQYGNILDIPNFEIQTSLVDDGDKKSYKVVANIPYNITSPILRKFTEQDPTPEMCVFLVQKEVGERITASPGQLSILGVTTQFFMSTEYLFTVPAKDFMPAPQVDSAVIRLVRDNRYLRMSQDLGLVPQDIFRIVRIGFSAKRKQLHNNLTAGLKLNTGDIKDCLGRLGVADFVRAQELSVEQWIVLTSILRTL